MQIVVVLPGRRTLLLAALVAAVAGALWWAASPADSQEDTSAPLATFAFLARADNPVDALAAGALAGQLGGPVYLTGTTSLNDQASQGLVATDPQVVVLAGGVAALTEQVATEVAALLPDAQVRRFAGTNRTETARLLNTLPAELGVGRPLITGATVAGDVGLDGTLTVAGHDVTATLTALTARIDSLESGLAAANNRTATLEATTSSLESDLAAANGRVAALEATLAGVSRAGDVLTFDAMNVQVTNGTGRTDSTNGLGNLIVGYNEDHTTDACRPSSADCQYSGDNAPDVRDGSHMLVIGDDHSYTSYGGIIAGQNNRTTGIFASVTGGQANTASGRFASVTGGRSNTASGQWAAVTGGSAGTASSSATSVTGGSSNTASDINTSVTGGQANTASGRFASVTGGRSNSAAARWSTVAGGRSEGIINTASNEYNSRIGALQFEDTGGFTDN